MILFLVFLKAEIGFENMKAFFEYLKKKEVDNINVMFPI